jgi:hypothetical protein
MFFYLKIRNKRQKYSSEWNTLALQRETETFSLFRTLGTTAVVKKVLNCTDNSD